MKNVTLWITAGILSVGIIVGAFCLKAGIDNFVNKDRVVAVKGLAVVEVPANKVTWPISFKEIGNDLPALYVKINNTTNRIIDFLVKNGIPQADIAITAPSVIDMEADRYNSQPVTQRYNITSKIIVTSEQVDKVRKLISEQGELLKEGIAIVAADYDSYVKYEFTKLNDIKPGLIREATKNARTTAQQFADDSDSDLGEIVSASQGQISIEDRDTYTPYIKTVRVVTSLNYRLEN